MRTLTVILTSRLHHLRSLEQYYSFIQNVPHEELGRPMSNMDCKLYYHWNIIVVSNFMYYIPITFDILTQSKYLLPRFLSRMSHQSIILISHQ